MHAGHTTNKRVREDATEHVQWQTGILSDGGLSAGVNESLSFSFS